VKTREFAPLVARETLLSRIRSEVSFASLPLMVSLLLLFPLFGVTANRYMAWKEIQAATAEVEREAQIRDSQRDTWIATLRTPHKDWSRAANEEAKISAAESLEVFPEAAAALAGAAVADPNPSVRSAAAWSLGRSQGAAKGAALLCLELKDEDPKRRANAAQALAAISAKVPGTRGSLEVALSDSNGEVRAWSARALWKISPIAAAPLVVPLLADPEPNVVSLSLSLLTDGPVEPLIQALDNPKVEIRRGATQAAAARLKLSDEIVTALIPRLADRDWQTRLAATSALESVGARAASAVPKLTLLLGDLRERIRYAAIMALHRIGPRASAAIPRLDALQRSGQSRHIRDAAREALEAIRR
jgi:HEAT repeat protein